MPRWGWLRRRWWLAALVTVSCNDCVPEDQGMEYWNSLYTNVPRSLMVYPDTVYVGSDAAASGVSFVLDAYVVSQRYGVGPYVDLSQPGNLQVGQVTKNGAALGDLPTQLVKFEGALITIKPPGGGPARYEITVTDPEVDQPALIVVMVVAAAAGGQTVSAAPTDHAAPPSIALVRGQSGGSCADAAFAFVGKVPLRDGPWSTDLACPLELSVFSAEQRPWRSDIAEAASAYTNTAVTLGLRTLPVRFVVDPGIVITDPDLDLEGLVKGLQLGANDILGKDAAGVQLVLNGWGTALLSYTGCTTDLRADNGDRLLVYLIAGELDEYDRGQSCGSRVILLDGTGHSPASLAHEVAHLLGLGHPNEAEPAVKGLNGTNLLWVPYDGSIPGLRGRLSLGQIYRANRLANSSAVNTLPAGVTGTPAGWHTVAACTISGECPPCGRDASQREGTSNALTATPREAQCLRGEQ